MNYHYHQIIGGNEEWKPVPSTMLDTVKESAFVTILSVDSPVAKDYTKEQYAEIKFKGPLYFDLDDSESPASTARNMVELIDKLVAKGVSVEALSLFASGGKGFHLLVPEEYYLAKPPAKGMAYLPAIYKEIAFDLAVRSMDMRVYTARKGRMFRQENVKRENGRYKVRITYEELLQVAELAKTNVAEAEVMYQTLCSEPRTDMWVAPTVSLVPDMVAIFDQAKAKVTKLANKAKKAKPIKLPENLPSFDAMLRGEGFRSDAGFHPIAMQIAITAHAKGMSKEDLLAAAADLCKNHESDGSRYNTESKRREELARMWDYTEDNPCYAYSPLAVTALLSHQAPDLRGLNVSEEEVLEGIEAGDAAIELGTEQEGEFDHAGIILTANGAYVSTDSGERKVTAMSFQNVTELVSSSTNTVSEIEAEIHINGEKRGNKVFDIDTFGSVASLNKMMMPYGQAFNGTDQHSRGMYMRLVEKARKARRRMYVVSREGLDILNMPFHEQEEARKDFMVWSDIKSVTAEPRIRDLEIQMKFVGFPTEAGQFQTDLSQAPVLSQWIKDEGNKEHLHSTIKALLNCQAPSYLGKLLGWMTACHYRMLFHKVYNKFPLLHINGAAGAGKCFAKGTPVLMFDGTIKAVEDVAVGDSVMGADGTERKVLSLGRGQEQMYRIKQNYGDDYVVNASHILSLKASDTKLRKLHNGRKVAKGDVVNIAVSDYLLENTSVQKTLKGYKSAGVPFSDRKLPVAAYMLGSWLGDGTSNAVKLCKPKHTKLYAWWKAEAESLGVPYTEGNSETCDTLYLGGGLINQFRNLGVIGNKHIPTIYKTGSETTRRELLAGLIDSHGTVNNSGYRFDTVCEKMANDVIFVARSLGIKATMTKEEYSNNFKTDATIFHVYLTGDVQDLPTLDKKTCERKSASDPLVSGIQIVSEGYGDYYGFAVDKDHLFLLGDFTVVHNTEMTKLMSNFHYLHQEPKMLTPSSTLFAVGYAASGSASIPLILDEFKPAEMAPQVYDKFKLMLRDAYNCRNMERGGGNKDSSDYRALHVTQLSAPICFIAEAAESESALMERVVLLTLIKPPVVQAQKYLHNFLTASSNKEVLGIIGSYMAAMIVQKYSLEKLEEEFNEIYNASRKELMLQEGEENTLSEEELQRKSGAKERVVFNYSVARFGLRKFSNLIENIFPNEFTNVLGAMDSSIFNTVADLQQQTIPEWLKVLNCFADMAKLGEYHPQTLREGVDFAYGNSNGKPAIELYARSCYMKYRGYCMSTKTAPLFPNDAAFVYSLQNLPSLVSKGLNDQLNVPGGSIILDLNELRAAGFIEPESRGSK